jgi:phytoene synthase
MSAPEAPSIRYFAWLYSVPAQQKALESLFGIEREVYESLRPGVDHHVAHSRLQWWREECERAADGKPVHPLMRELVAALDEPERGGFDEHGAYSGKMPQPALGERSSTSPHAHSQLAGLTGFVDTAIWDLASATFETRKELAAYCERWATAMIQPLVLPAADQTSGTSLDWRVFGAALREIEMLANLASDARHGRVRVPLDELQRAGVDPAVLAKNPWSDSVTGLLRARYDQLAVELSRSTSGLPPETQLRHRGLLVWAALSQRMARSAYRSLPGTLQPARMGAITDSWAAWASARKATLGRFNLGRLN